MAQECVEVAPLGLCGFAWCPSISSRMRSQVTPMDIVTYCSVELVLQGHRVARVGFPKMEKSRTAAFRQQLESLYSISIEVSRLHELPQVLDRALGCCLDLTQSAFGFIGLLNGSQEMDVAAIKGFEPSDPRFYEKFRLIPVRPSVFGVVITDRRSKISNDVLHDPDQVGQPPGHPPVRTFMGVPLQVGEKVIGMIGVANKLSGYTADEERLLSTFANQVAVAIENARLYEDQRRMIAELEDLHRDLSQAERDQVLREERERIAAELHDRIEQAIFSLGLKVNAIMEREPVTEPIASGLGEVKQLAVHTSEAVREAIFALSLPRPAASGLLAELRRLVREMGKSEELEADLVVSGTPLKLNPESEQTLYILAREALANVVRHAQARRVLVSLRYSDEHVDLVIQDDGAGASEQILNHYQESGTHFGMKRSRRQVEDLGGTFEVRNGEESGLAIRVQIPVRA
ncbi:MAG: GAF domain-containing protein [Chloroflexi bacterium]|nr:MAG: GAF domain-containing protein [Chloroflexota bacterium]